MSPPKSTKNYFVVDACFLVEKYIPIGTAPTSEARDQLRKSKQWWVEIDRQLNDERARVYVPDLCIAEAFKVLAKKNYQESVFKHAADYKKARETLSADITTDHKVLKGSEPLHQVSRPASNEGHRDRGRPGSMSCS